MSATTNYSGTKMEPLAVILKDSARPSFLFGCTPPREGTSDEKALEALAKFTSRSSVLATDGFIVYDIQDEASRTSMERPFPFRRTMDPAKYAALFPELCGKECVVYKCVAEESEEDFSAWLTNARTLHGHSAFNLVGAASSSPSASSSSMKDDSVATSALVGPKVSLARAGQLTSAQPNCAFGCVCIPERHTSKGNEDANMLKKIQFGCEWFITQGIFASEPVIKLIHDYAAMCKKEGITPKKIILTFAPCGRAKTLYFIKWLGMHVPPEVEARLFPPSQAAVAEGVGVDGSSASVSVADVALDHVAVVRESVKLHAELLTRILEQTAGTGVPLGINVESLSIFKEEIDAAHTLFQSLQTLILNGRGSPWSVRWIDVKQVISREHSRGRLTPVTSVEFTSQEFKRLSNSSSGSNLCSSSDSSQSSLVKDDEKSKKESRVEVIGADDIELEISDLKITVAELKAALLKKPEFARQLATMLREV